MKSVARLALLSALAWAQARAWTIRGGRRLRQGTRVARRHEALLFARAAAKHRSSAQASSKMVEQMKLVHKTAYWGQMSLGSPPQPFKVIFDTGSGNLIVPAADCNVPGCAPHKKYNNKASTTSSFVTNERGEGSSEITFGTGQVSGDFYKDRLCIGDSLCFDANFIAADKMTTEPFREIPFDGIMGLGFKDLSMGDGFNIVDDLANRAGAGSVFSFFVSDDDDSEVTFGGYRSERLASDIVWAPVKVQSWWQVAIDDITFNNVPKNLCNGACQVAVDTGTSMLAGPSDLVDQLSSMVNAKDDCSNFNELPTLGFQLGDTVLNLRPEDYMDKSDSGCSFSLMALDVPPPKGPVFIFGDPFLRRFVTIYDRSKPAVGFAVARHSGSADEVAASSLIAKVRGGGGGSAPVSSSPAEASSASAVNLHLDGGLMTGEGSDDSGSGSSGSDAASSSYSTDSATPPPQPASYKPYTPDAAAPEAPAAYEPAASTASSWSAASAPVAEPASTASSSSASTPAVEPTAASSWSAASSPDTSAEAAAIAAMRAYGGVDAPSAPAAAAPSAPAAHTKAESSEEDPIAAMRRLLGKTGSFIQTPSKRMGQHLFSVRLHREK